MPFAAAPNYKLDLILSLRAAYTGLMHRATPARFLAAHEATASAPPVLAGFLLSLVPLRDACATRLHQQLPPPRAGLRVSVIIPAKDEAANLPATLTSLAAQTNWRGRALPPNTFEVIVLANNCADATATVVRRQAWRYLGQIGAARPGLGQGGFAHIHGQQVAAARGQLRREHAQRTADFKRGGVVGAGQHGQPGAGCGAGSRSWLGSGRNGFQKNFIRPGKVRQQFFR